MMIEVKVHPRARIEKVERDPAGSFTVWTTSPPDKGAANSAVAKLLAKELGVAPSRVVLRRGGASRHKVFEIV
jgi:uncharacterized protein